MSARDETPIKVLAPALLVRLEGAAIMALALYLYTRYGGGWFLFAAVVLLPDVTIPLYLVDRRTGAAVYNLAHTYLWPAALVGMGVASDNDLLLSIGLIWFVHIGVDRLFGFGLKYPSDFKKTHIQRL